MSELIAGYHQCYFQYQNNVQKYSIPNTEPYLKVGIRLRNLQSALRIFLHRSLRIFATNAQKLDNQLPEILGTAFENQKN